MKQRLIVAALGIPRAAAHPAGGACVGDGGFVCAAGGRGLL